MFRKFFTLIGTIGILVGFVFLIGFLGSLRPNIEPQTPDLAPPTVFYQTAEPRSVTLDVRVQGEVRPRTDITLTAQVSGRIVETGPGFVNGGAFEKGDLLVKIEDADYRYAVVSARSRVAQAVEALRREEAETALARRDYEELGFSDDPSALTLRQPQLAQARAAYEAARAELQTAELNLARTSIEAPFKGRMRDRMTGEGQYVAPGAQLGRIFSTDIAEIRLALTDSALAQLGLPIDFTETEDQPGPPVVLSAVVAGKAHEWRGRIVRADGAIDAATRQVSVIAVVDDPYGAGADDGAPLAMGLFVEAAIEGKPYENAIVLPRSALYGRDAVYVIAGDNTLQRRVVEIVASGRDDITVVSGVAAGERVATSPLRGAEEGDKVTPTDPTTVGRDGDRQEPAPVADNASLGDAL